VFALAFLPVVPSLQYLFHTAGSHVFVPAPRLLYLAVILMPGAAGVLLFAPALVAAAFMRSEPRIRFPGWQILLCLSLALIPVLILYGVSVATPIHCFSPRHVLEAVPGIALCWAMLLGSIRSRTVRLAICVALVAIAAYLSYSDPLSRRHEYTWKYALEAAERNASIDNAPVLICSDFPEADYVAMPLDSAKESRFFAPLSYYRLSVPVVPLPRALNGEAIRVGSRFLQEAATRHERFLAMAFEPSYRTLDWLAESAAGTYTVRTLGVYDKIEVLEFVPRSAPSEAARLPESGKPGPTAPAH
jgi:hypothetical protein